MANVKFDETIKKQIVNVIIRFQEVKNKEATAAWCGVAASVFDGVNKTVNAFSERSINKAKIDTPTTTTTTTNNGNTSTTSTTANINEYPGDGTMLVMAWMTVLEAAAKASQEVFMAWAKVSMPSQGEIEITNKFFYVEGETDADKYTNLRNAIIDRQKTKDKKSLEDSKTKGGEAATKSAEANSQIIKNDQASSDDKEESQNRTSNIQKASETLFQLNEKKLQVNNTAANEPEDDDYDKARKAMKLAVIIKKDLNDLLAIRDAPYCRTKGHALYEATETAFNVIATQYDDAKFSAKKDSAGTNAQTAGDKKGLDANSIKWNVAAKYYWDAYAMARAAIQAFTTAVADIKDENKQKTLNDAKSALQHSIEANKFVPPATDTKA